MILDHSFKEILSCFYTNISPKILMAALHYIFFAKVSMMSNVLSIDLFLLLIELNLLFYWSEF